MPRVALHWSYQKGTKQMTEDTRLHYTTKSYDECLTRLHDINRHFPGHQMRGVPGEGFAIVAPEGYRIPWGQK
jgi:hypothetical protein